MTKYKQLLELNGKPLETEDDAYGYLQEWRMITKESFSWDVE